MNSLVETPNLADIDRVLEWKTALYSFINPLHVGMVLAGADCHYTDAITPFALHLGRAFQITDDMLGIFSDEKEAGKSPLDDIREGKATILSVYALMHASDEDKQTLRACLGNSGLTVGDFNRCKRIIRTSGALTYAQDKAAREITQALDSLQEQRHNWPPAYVAFLEGLAHIVQHRTA